MIVLIFVFLLCFWFGGKGLKSAGESCLLVLQLLFGKDHPGLVGLFRQCLRRHVFK